MNLDIVVVTFQSAEHLPRCLAGLPGAARVIVVDNASTDGSADLAAELGAEVVRNPDNRGFAAAANQGARLGDGEAILFLNPDASVDGPGLGPLLSALDDPTVAVAGSRLVGIDGREQRSHWPYPSPALTWLEAFGLHRLAPVARRLERLPAFLVGACLLVRRSAFERLGGFDEAFWLYGEEADLCRRAWNAGWRLRHVAVAAVRHVGGASGNSAPAATFEHFHRGTEYFIAKHHGRLGLLSHRIGLLLGCLLRVAAFAAVARRTQLRLRAAMIMRLLRVLLRHPVRVAP